MFNEIQVKIEDLVLDPNNPRFSKHHSQETPEEHLLDETEQEKTLQIMLQSGAFAVDELMDSIKSKGFKPVGKIFVKKIADKYLVVEGNRRVSAIKHLLAKHKEGKKGDVLPEEILETLTTLNVNDVSERSDDAIRELIALIHLGGFKEWKPLPASYSIYRAYMKELAVAKGVDEKDPNSFIYDPIIAKRVKELFAVTLSQVRSSVRIYRAHLQLMELSHDHRVEDENNYSMIGDTIKSVELSKYFGFDENRGVFSEEGAEKFLDLCLIGSDKNPSPVITASASGESSLRDLEFVLGSSSATSEDLRRIVEDRVTASRVAASVKSRQDKDNLVAALQQIFTILKGVELGLIETEGGLAGAEKKLIADIESRLIQIKRAAGD